MIPTCRPWVPLGAFLLMLMPAVAFTAEPPMDKCVLLDAQSARKWSPAESTVEPSTARTRENRPALHWHIPVDHFAGEAKYPIGWPRMDYAFRDPAPRDWSAWDFFQLWIYTDTSRDALPLDPVGLAIRTPDKNCSYGTILKDARKGQWVRILIPIAKLPRPDDVRSMQLHIAEARYRHKDTLDFYIDDVALLRYARPTLLNFTTESSAMFADARHIPVSFELLGIKPGESVDVLCEVRQGGKIAAKTTVKATRGVQRVTLDLGSQKLLPGDCELLACVKGGQSVSTKLRLVASPWSNAE